MREKAQTDQHQTDEMTEPHPDSERDVGLMGGNLRGKPIETNKIPGGPGIP